MRRIFSKRGYTLAEVTIALFSIGILGMALTMFSSTSTRFIARNLATNHSHEAARIASMELLRDLRDAATSFRQFNYDGTSYTTVTAVATTDVDALTGLYAGNRTNGITYRQIFAGPLVMTTNTTPTTTSIAFTFPPGTTLPIAGDKVNIPLVSQPYDITAVSVSGTTVTLTLGQPVGYTLNTVSPNLITGNFYRKVAFTVYNNELRYHPNFNGANRDTYKVVRNCITSPLPFSLLFKSDGSTDSNSVRVSLEITDLGYSQQKFGNGTTTLYTVIPARNQPTVLATAN